MTSNVKKWCAGAPNYMSINDKLGVGMCWCPVLSVDLDPLSHLRQGMATPHLSCMFSNVSSSGMLYLSQQKMTFGPIQPSECIPLYGKFGLSVSWTNWKKCWQGFIRLSEKYTINKYEKAYVFSSHLLAGKKEVFISRLSW